QDGRGSKGVILWDNVFESGKEQRKFLSVYQSGGTGPLGYNKSFLHTWSIHCGSGLINVWYKNDSLSAHHNSFSLQRILLMDNITLRVATFYINGHVEFYKENNKISFLNGGAISRLFLLLQEKLNFRYEIVIERALGNKSPNGSWNGRIGLLTRNEVDIAFPIGLNYKIYEDVDITPPTHLTEVKFLISSAEGISKIYALIRILNFEVWIAAIFATLISTVIFYKIFSFEARLYKRNPPPLLNVFWTLLGTFTNQGKEALINLDFVYKKKYF
ncbi:glutamate receptor 1-like, partial [Centruroides sculpturatus]|uniref:glutamate receptor 1-like n=1 Tax=Centruroides sculpturatus TaxID=218467 RepID=UPI000C6CF172